VMPRFLRQRNLGHNRGNGRNEEEAKQRGTLRRRSGRQGVMLAWGRSCFIGPRLRASPR
jgi:hypothetical protein